MTLLAVALDLPTLEAAAAAAAEVAPHVDVLKVGLELLAGDAEATTAAIAGFARPVFADVKFHDIPRTVAAAARTVSQLPVDYITVHTAGGAAMLEAAVEGCAAGAALSGRPRPQVLGVTVLTSLDRSDLASTGIDADPVDLVRSRAALAAAAGLDGLVCAAPDLPAVRDAAPGLLLVTPGIRPAGHQPGSDDQARIATPEAAVAAGAGMVVVGRPVIAAADRAAAAAAVRATLRATPPPQTRAT